MGECQRSLVDPLAPKPVPCSSSLSPVSFGVKARDTLSGAQGLHAPALTSWATPRHVPCSLLPVLGHQAPCDLGLLPGPHLLPISALESLSQ